MFSSFFMRQNVAVGSFEGNSILKECLGKMLSGALIREATPMSHCLWEELNVDASGVPVIVIKYLDGLVFRT